MKNKTLMTIALAINACIVSTQAFIVPIGNYLNPGHRFVDSEDPTVTSATRMSVGTFLGTPNFSDSATTLFAAWVPLNLNAAVNFNDSGDGSVPQASISITSYGNQIILTSNGSFTDAIRNARIGNAYEFGDADPDGDPTTAAEDPSFYNQIAGLPIYLWVSNVTAANSIHTASRFSIFDTGALLDSTANVAFGNISNYNASAVTSARVKDGGVALIPEPSAALLVIAGSAGLIARRRRS